MLQIITPEVHVGLVGLPDALCATRGVSPIACNSACLRRTFRAALHSETTFSATSRWEDGPVGACAPSAKGGKFVIRVLELVGTKFRFAEVKAVDAEKFFYS